MRMLIASVDYELAKSTTHRELNSNPSLEEKSFLPIAHCLLFWRCSAHNENNDVLPFMKEIQQLHNVDMAQTPATFHLSSHRQTRFQASTWRARDK